MNINSNYFFPPPFRVSFRPFDVSVLRLRVAVDAEATAFVGGDVVRLRERPRALLVFPSGLRVTASSCFTVLSLVLLFLDFGYEHQSCGQRTRSVCAE